MEPEPMQIEVPDKPTFLIVTPTRNQAGTIKACIESVLGQEGLQTEFDLQYVVLDGGSDDGSVEIIRRFEDRLFRWRSKPDDGPYAAINEGFGMADGDILAWLNGDDLLCPWALRSVASIFRSLPDCQWLTSRRPMLMASNGQIAGASIRIGFSSEAVRIGAHHPDSPEALPYIQQESTFFSRRLWDRTEGLAHQAYPLSADFDLWVQMASHAELESVDVPLGIFRAVQGQRSQDAERYALEAEKSLRDRHGIDLIQRRRAARRLSRRLRSRLLGYPRWSYNAEHIRLENVGADHPRWKRHPITIHDLSQRELND